MTLRIVRLGAPRDPQEGTRVGTVLRPPRGVRKERYAPDDWFDVWFPDLERGADTKGQAGVTETEWKRFVRTFKAEMNAPTARRTLDLLAALSHGTSLSIACYCENEARCYGSVLRELLRNGRGPGF